MNEGAAHPSRPATILIVDDMPANLQLLQSLRFFTVGG